MTLNKDLEARETERTSAEGSTAVAAVGDNDHAIKRYEQTEAFCIEGTEHSQVLESLTQLMKETDRACELLDKAVDETSKQEMFGAYSKPGKEAFCDEKFAASLLSKLKDKCENLEDYKVLAVFQECEKQITFAGEFILLAAAVMEELDGRLYAVHLLAKAEEMLQSMHFDVQQYRSLILAVDQLTGDSEWVQRLLDESASKVYSFIQVQTLGRTATVALTDRDFGNQWTHEFYKSWQQRLLSEDSISNHELSKLARAVNDELDEREWGLALLEEASKHCKSHFDIAYIGQYAREWGETGLADRYYHDAVGKCTNADEMAQLIKLESLFGREKGM